MLRFTLPILMFFQLGITETVLAQGTAGQAGEYLRAGVGAKALGLGRAFTSISDDASALYWNPAGLSALSRVGGSFMFMHVPLREGASFNYLAGAIPLRLFFANADETSSLANFVQEFSLGLGVLWHSLGEFEFYNEDASRGLEQSQNSIGQSAVYLSLAYPLNNLFRKFRKSGKLGWASFIKGDLNVGLTTKFIKQDLFGFHGTATSFDFGAKYSHYSGIFSVGFSWRDLNQSTISYGGDVIGDKIPSIGLLGFSVKPPFGAMRALLLAFDYSLFKPAARDRDFMFGLQYDFSVINPQLPIKLRLGTNSNYESITVGINFSPELILGQDWVPYADYAYANNKGSFEAVGARYSISVDRNPFDARYWYDRGMARFPKLENNDLSAIDDDANLMRYLINAQKARNPAKRAYRYEASLRQADLEFLATVRDLRTENAGDRGSNRSTERLNQVLASYTTGASKYLVEDYGKSDFDRDEYFKSFVFYTQSLILSGRAGQAATECAEKGRSWGKQVNMLRYANGSFDQWSQNLNYLQAFSLYKNNFTDEAKDLIGDQLTSSSLATYLSAHIAFVDGNYDEVLNHLNGIDLNDTRFPTDIFLPLTEDGVFGDEILFLKAAAMYRLSTATGAKDYVAELAKIPRFFPFSDMAKFLTQGDGLLFTLVKYHQERDERNFNKLANGMIQSYLEAFANGALKEESYASNYDL